jgi:N-acetylmuramic acid 6-phosphate etherase
MTLSNMGYAVLSTEQNNPNTQTIDLVPVAEALAMINAEDATVPHAIAQALPALTQLVEAAVAVMRAGGALVYVGAGTSGRLAVLDAAECPPTFNAEPDQVIALIAGGPSAMVTAAEGAEDNAEAGAADLAALLARLPHPPFVVGVSASGSAAYVHAALQHAKTHSCQTGSVTCHPQGVMVTQVDYPVVVMVGAEAITGSTRMKAGTAQKLVLNMISTCCMVQLGKTYQNWMVDVKPTNLKLQQRALRIVGHLGQVESEQALACLQAAQWHTKAAVVMAKQGCTLAQAQAQLATHHGKLRAVLQNG